MEGAFLSEKQNPDTIRKISDRYDDIIFKFTSVPKIFQQLLPQKRKKPLLVQQNWEAIFVILLTKS